MWTAWEIELVPSYVLVWFVTNGNDNCFSLPGEVRFVHTWCLAIIRVAVMLVYMHACMVWQGIALHLQALKHNILSN